jgi:hypothetical protein
MSTNVSEEHFASISRVEEKAKQETGVKKVASRDPKKSVGFQRTIRCYIPEDITLREYIGSRD